MSLDNPICKDMLACGSLIELTIRDMKSKLRELGHSNELSQVVSELEKSASTVCRAIEEYDIEHKPNFTANMFEGAPHA